MYMYMYTCLVPCHFSCVLRIAPHPWNLILGYILHMWPENVHVYTFLRWTTGLDRILGGGRVRRNSSDDGVTPINNSTACRTCWMSSRLSQTMLVARRSCHPVKAGQGTCGEEALARGLAYLSLMCYLCHIRALLVMWIMLASSLHLRKFVPAKIYTREN